MRFHPAKLFFFVLIVSICWLVVRPPVHDARKDAAERLPFAGVRAAPPKRSAPVHLDSASLDRYTGEYRVSSPKVRDAATGDVRTLPDVTLVVTAESGGLFVQTAGLPKLEMLSESDRSFFFTNVDARIEFVADPSGRMKELTVRLPGQDDLVGNRIR